MIKTMIAFVFAVTINRCDNPHQRSSTIQARAVVSNIVSNTDATLKRITGRT